MRLKKLLSLDRLNDALGLGGALLLSYGFYLAWVPLGFMVGGALLIAWAVLAGLAANTASGNKRA